MTPPSWERSLAQMVALHDLAVAGYDLTGNAAAVESARLEVVAVIDRTIAAGVPESAIDAALSHDAIEGANS